MRRLRSSSAEGVKVGVTTAPAYAGRRVTDTILRTFRPSKDLNRGVSHSAFDESTHNEVIPPTLIPCADGVRVAVHDLGGPADANADILLFSHATGLHGRTWDPVAAQLTDRYRCFAIDHRGHGVSETPDDAGLAWSHMGDDTVAGRDGGLCAPQRVRDG